MKTGARGVVRREPRPVRSWRIDRLLLAGLVALACALLPVRDASPSSGDQPPGESTVERGPVRATVRVQPTAVPIGDPISVTLEVTAEPGVELLMPSFGGSFERFAIVDFVPRERIDERGRTVATQTYRLETTVSGAQVIVPLMIEFVDRRPGQRPAPEGEDAYEILTERVGFTVSSVLPENATAELAPPLGRLDPIARAETARGPLTAAVAAGLVVAAGVGWWLWRARSAHRRGASPYQMASERLAALSAGSRPPAGDREAMDDFFVELSDIVRHYLEDRFGLHAPELTTEEFLDVAAGSPDLTSEHRGFLRDFLRQADRVKFARHLPAPDSLEETLAAVGGFLEQTGQEQAGREAGTPSAVAAREAA